MKDIPVGHINRDMGTVEFTYIFIILMFLEIAYTFSLKIFFLKDQSHNVTTRSEVSFS